MIEFIVQPINILTWLACYAIFLVYLGLGFFVKNRIETEVVRPVIGFSVVCFAYYLPLFVPGLVSFDALLLVLATLAGLGWIIAIRSNIQAALTWASLLIISMPISLMFSARTDFGWDAYTAWLPQAKFIFLNRAFPQLGSPTFAIINDYPYGLPLQHALVDIVVGSYRENVTTILNAIWPWTLLVWFFKKEEPLKIRISKIFTYSIVIYLWQMCLGEKLPGAAFAEPVLCILVAHAGLYIAHCCFSANDASQKDVVHRFISSVLIFSSLSFMKETGLLYCLAILSGFFLAHLIVERPNNGANIGYLSFAILLLATQIILRIVWSIYLGRAGISKTFVVQSLQEWHWSSLTTILFGILEQINHRPFWVIFSALLLILAFKSVKSNGKSEVALPTTISSWNFKLIAVTFTVSAATFAAFLFVIYLSAFSEFEARKAASFSRYMAPMGTLLAAGLVLCLSVRFQEMFERRRSIINIIGVAVYLSFAGSIVLLWQIGFVQASEIFTQLDRARDMILASVAKGEAIKLINQKGRCVPMLDGFYLNYITSGFANIGSSSCIGDPPISPSKVVSEMDGGAYRYALIVTGSADWDGIFLGGDKKITLITQINGRLIEVAHVD